MKFMQLLKNERYGKALAVEVIDENCCGLDSDVRRPIVIFIARLSVHLSVCSSRSVILWKRLNILSYFLHHMVAQSL